MAKYIVDSLQMVSLADAIRTKGGTSASMTFPDGMISAVNDITAGGGAWVNDLAKSSSLTTVAFDGSIFKLALSGNSYVGGVDMPNCTEIGSNCFYNCSNISYMSLPNVKIVGSSAFRSCFSISSYGSGEGTLTSISLPECEEIGEWGFGYQTGGFIYQSNYISSFYTPKVKKLGSYAFAGWYNNMKVFSFPSLEELGMRVFGTDGQVQTKSVYLYLSKMKVFSPDWYANHTGYNNFIDLDTNSNLYSIKNLDLPNCTTFYWYSNAYPYSINLPNCVEGGFYGNASLTYFSVPNLETLSFFKINNPSGTYTFSKVNKLAVYCFSGCNIQSVDLPLVSALTSGQEFYNCTIREISLPNCSWISYSCFNNCNQLSMLTISADCFYPYNYVTSNGNSLIYNTSLYNSVGNSVYIKTTTNSMQFLYSADPATVEYEGSVTGIWGAAFYNHTNLTKASFPNIKYLTLSTCVFSGCTNLSVLSFPNVESISGGFALGLKSENASLGLVLSFPKLKSVVGNFSPMGAVEVRLPYAKFSNITGNWGLTYCSYLEMPRYSGDMYSWFLNNSNIKSFNLDNCRFMRMSNCYRAYNLESAMLPLCSWFNSDTFSSCSAISVVQCSNGNKYGSGIFSGATFNGCKNLSIFIMAGKDLSPASGINFYATPIGQSTYLGYFGSIYVRSELVNTFKTLSGWSIYSSRFTALENLPTSIYQNLKIPFSIGTEWFVAKMSSTFADWINSYNNTLDFYLSNNLVYSSNGVQVANITGDSIIDLSHDTFSLVE